MNTRVIIDYWIEKANEDYRPLVTFEQEQVSEILEKSREFVQQIVDLINGGGRNTK